MICLSLLLAGAMLAAGCDETACKTQTAPQAQTCLYDQMNTDGQEGLCDEELRAYQQARYQRYDENGNGDITIAEFRSGMMEDFAAADANGDDVITQEEMSIWGVNRILAKADGTAPKEQRLLWLGGKLNDKSPADTDDDGTLDRAEVAGIFAAMHRNADADGDGKVTRQEFDKQVARIFNTIDADDSGIISRDELLPRRRRPGLGAA
jgi:hypothetical protein